MRLLPVVALLALAGSSLAADLPPPLNAIRDSVQQAQSRCQEFMHDDAREYHSCLQALFAAAKGNSAAARQQRMGIAYFAWNGAQTGAHSGMPEADSSAQYWLPRLRRLQHELHLSDEQLCQTLAGDCKVRTAQMQQMERDLSQAKAADAKRGKSAARH